jgi:hypothetical protein
MISRLQKTIILVFVTLALQVSVTAAPRLVGTLKTRDSKPIMVNGNKTGSDTTILSESHIQCPEKIGATVDLGALGRLDIAPKTDLTLSFSASEIRVQLKSGYVLLTTKKGISGIVTTSEGDVFRTDSSKLSSVVGLTHDAGGPETAAAVGAAPGGIRGRGAAGILGAGAAVVGGAAAAKSSGRSSGLSSDNPRQP